MNFFGKLRECGDGGKVAIPVCADKDFFAGCVREFLFKGFDVYEFVFFRMKKVNRGGFFFVNHQYGDFAFWAIFCQNHF